MATQSLQWRRPGRVRDVCQCQRQAKANRQQLFGVEPDTLKTWRGMSSTHSTTAATSSDCKTFVQKTVAFDAVEANSAASGMIRSSLTCAAY